jgi:hypothetical protein
MRQFHLDQLKNSKNVAVIESVIHSVFGRRYSVNPVLGSGGAPPGPLFPKPQHDLSSDPKVKKVLDSLPGSKIVGIE